MINNQSAVSLPPLGDFTVQTSQTPQAPQAPQVPTQPAQPIQPVTEPTLPVLTGSEIPGGTQSLVGGDVNGMADNGYHDLNFDKSKRKTFLANKTYDQIQALAKSGVYKLQAISSELKSLYVERDEVITDMIRAVAIGAHMLLLGPPGTGKSAMTRDLCSRIVGGEFFQWLLNRTSDPSELLGPFSIKAMERDQFLRKFDGKLPTANIAFIDEIFKSNEPTLNILLPLLNEGIFFNDGKPVEVPLVSMISASNELPEEEELMALYDRILFRNYVDLIKDASNRKKMMVNFINKRKQIAGQNNATTITLEELEAIRFVSCTVDCHKSVFDELNKLVKSIRNESINLSDRRLNEVLKVLQGTALLRGRTQFGTDDFDSLKNVLWERTEDIDKISSLLAKYVNPIEDKLTQIRDKFNEIKNRSFSTDATKRSEEAIQSNAELTMLTTTITTIRQEAASKGKDVSEIDKLNEEIASYNQQQIQDNIGVNFR